MGTDSRTENKVLYKEKSEALRKWISIYRKVAEHGERSVYERILAEAFNLTELLLDNYIDKFSAKHKKEAIPVEDREDVYQYPHIKGWIDYNMRKNFKGKTILVGKMGVALPKELDEVREVRNFYTHSTVTFKEREARELEDYEMFEKYVMTLGQTIGRLFALPKSELFPGYSELKVQEGMEIGRNNEYVILESYCERQTERIFIGKSARINADVYIVEIIPSNKNTNLVERYKELYNVRKNGLARMVDLVQENGTVYLIFEKIAGVPLYKYMKEKELSLEEREKIYHQMESLIAIIEKQGIYASFNPKNLVLDEEGLLWLQQYGTEFKEQNIGLAKNYCLKALSMDKILNADSEGSNPKPELEVNTPKAEEPVEMVVNTPKAEEHAEMVVNTPKAEEPVEMVVNTPKAEEYAEIVVNIPKTEEPVAVPEKEPQVAPNNYNKLWAVISIGVGIIVLLWIISTIIG